MAMGKRYPIYDWVFSSKHAHIACCAGGQLEHRNDKRDIFREARRLVPFGIKRIFDMLDAGMV